MSQSGLAAPVTFFYSLMNAADVAAVESGGGEVGSITVTGDRSFADVFPTALDFFPNDVYTQPANSVP